MWVYPNYKQGIAWSYLLDEICLHLKYTKANNYNVNGMHFVLCIKGFFALNLVMFQTLNNSPIPWILAEYPPPPPRGGGGGAETDTILKTEKPLGRGVILGTRKIRWLQWVTNRKYKHLLGWHNKICEVNLCIMCWAEFCQFIEGKEITTRHAEKKGVTCFYHV